MKRYSENPKPICIIEHQRKLNNLNANEIHDLLKQIDDKILLYDPIEKEESKRREERIKFFLSPKGEEYFEKRRERFVRSKEYKYVKRLLEERQEDIHLEKIGQVVEPKIVQIKNTGWNET